MGGTAQEIQPKNDDEDDAGVDGVHVSEGDKCGGIGAAIVHWEREWKNMDEQPKNKT